MALAGKSVGSLGIGYWTTGRLQETVSSFELALALARSSGDLESEGRWFAIWGLLIMLCNSRNRRLGIIAIIREKEYLKFYLAQADRLIMLRIYLEHEIPNFDFCLI
jgi:hypothetical protein